MFHGRLFLFICLLSLLLVSPGSADDTPTFRTSATVVAVNVPFNATCTLASPPTSGSYLVAIERSGETVVDYLVPAIDPDHTGSRVPKVAITTSHFADFTIRSLAANSTHFTVSITHLTLGRFTYSCSSDYTQSSSKEVHISVVKETASASISANVSNPVVGVPFTLTCSLSGFTPGPKDNYSVAYYSKRDAFLGSYKIEGGSGSPPILSTLEHEHLTVSRGARAAFPHFDITLTEATDLSQEYWCVVKLPGQAEVASAHWGTGLTTLIFTTTKGPEASTRAASCRLNNFQPKAQAYSVDFFSQQGPTGSYRLGGYKVDSKGLLAFSGTKFDDGSSHTVYGVSHAYPNFDILAYLAQHSPTYDVAWWCTLSVGSPGSSDYHLYTSQKATIA